MQCDLTDGQILELYHSGKVFYVEESANTEEDILLAKALNRMRRCEKFISKGKNMDHVRTYYISLFSSPERLDYLKRMSDARKRCQFICEHVGCMLSLGILFGKTPDIAKALGYKSVQLDSVERYIRKGKKMMRDLLDMEQSV